MSLVICVQFNPTNCNSSLIFFQSRVLNVSNKESQEKNGALVDAVVAKLVQPFERLPSYRSKILRNVSSGSNSSAAKFVCVLL